MKPSGATLGVLAGIYVNNRAATGDITDLTALTVFGILTAFVIVIGDRPAAKLDRPAIDAYLTSLRRVAPSTRRTRFSAVRGFSRWLTAERHLRLDPCLGVRSPKVPRPSYRALEQPDSTALLAACDNPTERLVVTLGLQLGLRRAEIAGLELGDVAFVDGTVRVRKGKGGHQRLLPLTAACRDALAAYLASRPIQAGPLIRGVRNPGQGVPPIWVGRLVSAIAYRAGVKQRPWDGVATHSLRHSCATDVYRQTRDVEVVRDMLGHTSLNATQVYVRCLDVERLREGMEGRDYRRPLRTVA